ncbi:MAG: hypothetical protein ACLP01_25765 [Solirubrobacteraceae bacterium]
MFLATVMPLCNQDNPSSGALGRRRMLYTTPGSVWVPVGSARPASSTAGESVSYLIW